MKKRSLHKKKQRNNRRRKIGRNDPCWCGSGKKYKQCHFDRERQEPLRVRDASSEFRKAYSARICLAPEEWKHDCSNQISKAHTVSKAGSLERIARTGHVYAFVPSLENLRKNKGLLVPELYGINRASTFTGFCSKHDDAIFAPLEKTIFSGTPEQCFLIGYRALARENFTKQAAFSLIEFRRELDRGKPLSHQIDIQTLNLLYELGLSAAVKDNEYYKRIYDDVLINRKFGDVRAYIVETENIPPVMCSGGVYPEQDFEGNKLQDICDLKQTPHSIYFSSFYGGQYGAIVFTWLPESDRTCRAFIQSLHRVPTESLVGALLRFFFEFCENVHISPEWWEQLPSSAMDAIVRRMSESANPTIERVSGCLKDDGVRFPPWVIIQRKTIGFAL